MALFLTLDIDVKGLAERIMEKERDGGGGLQNLILIGENLLRLGC